MNIFYSEVKFLQQSQKSYLLIDTGDDNDDELINIGTIIIQSAIDYDIKMGSGDDILITIHHFHNEDKYE